MADDIRPSDMSMRERIARAIITAWDDNWNDLHADDKAEMFRAADAILAALAEPTEAMKECALAYWPDDPEHIWKAMLTEASK